MGSGTSHLPGLGSDFKADLNKEGWPLSTVISSGRNRLGASPVFWFPTHISGRQEGKWVKSSIMPLCTTEMTWTCRISLILARRRYGLRVGVGANLWSGRLWAKINAIPRDTSPSRPAGFFSTCQVMDSGNRFAKRPYIAACFKSTFKGTEQSV